MANLEKPAGSLGVPLGDVAESLAGTPTDVFGSICPYGALLTVPEQLFKLEEPGDWNPSLATERFVRLEVLPGVRDTKLHFLSSKLLRLGSSPATADVVLEGELVAEKHAMLRRADADWELLGSHSPNGTFVEDRRLEPAKGQKIAYGQRLRLGDCDALLLSGDALRELVVALAPNAVDPNEVVPMHSPKAAGILPPAGVPLDTFLDRLEVAPWILKSLDAPFLFQVPVKGEDAVAASDPDALDSTQPVSLKDLEALKRGRSHRGLIIHALVSPEGAEVVLGRDPKCDVMLPAGTVSQRHATIFLSKTGWCVLDKGSSNGTYVKGCRAPEGLPISLKSGDELWFARYRALFLLPSSLYDLLKGMLKDREKLSERRTLKAVRENKGAAKLQPATSTFNVNPEDAKTAVGWLVCPPLTPIALLPGSTLTIGRSKDCEVVLAHPDVSRQHARVRVIGKDVWVLDLGGRNGTFVNGKQGRRTRVSSNDVVTIGAYDIQVLSPEDMSSRAAIDVEVTRPREVGLSSGTVAPGSMAELLQSQEFNAKTVTLKVSAGGLRGMVAFRDGRPFAAEFGEHKGREAVLQLILLDAGRYVLSARVDDTVEKNLDETVTALLLEACRRNDEEPSEG